MSLLLRKQEKGQAAAEFGVILPAIIILIIAVIVLGRPYYLKLVAQNVAYSQCSASARSNYKTGFGSMESQEQSTGMTFGAGNVVVEEFAYWGGNSLVLANVACRALMTSEDAAYDLWYGGAGLDGVIKGVAVFYPAPFISEEFGK